MWKREAGVSVLGCCYMRKIPPGIIDSDAGKGSGTKTFGFGEQPLKPGKYKELDSLLGFP